MGGISAPPTTGHGTSGPPARRMGTYLSVSILGRASCLTGCKDYDTGGREIRASDSCDRSAPVPESFCFWFQRRTGTVGPPGIQGRGGEVLVLKGLAVGL